jgi:copper chaperone CopZ
MTTQLTVGGMGCGGCVSHVTEVLQGVEGVQDAKVDLDSGTATVQHGETTQPAQLVEAVVEAGYQAQVS